MLRVRILACGLAAGLSACAATAPPLEQVRSIAQASEAFGAASQPLLDDLAAAERDHARELVQSPPADAANVLVVPGAGGVGERRVLLDLPLDLASALATIGDPPVTAELRGGVAAIRHYAAVLVRVAEGQDLAAARAELGLLATSLAELAFFLPGKGDLAVRIGPALTALRPLIDDIARVKAGAGLRRLLVELAPQIKSVSDGLRSTAQPLFATLAGRVPRTIAAGGDAAAAVAGLEAHRVAIADWLVLLDMVDQATDQLVAALAGPGDPAKLAGLGELSGRVAASAQGSRRALAALRAEP